MLAASSPRLPPLLPPLSPSFAARPPLARPPFMAFAARLLSSSSPAHAPSPRRASPAVPALHRPPAACDRHCDRRLRRHPQPRWVPPPSHSAAPSSLPLPSPTVPRSPPPLPPPASLSARRVSLRAPHLPSSVAPRVALRAGGAASEPLERSEKRRGVATMAATPSNAETTGSAEEAPLAARRCVPCEGKGLLPLAGDHIAALLEQVPGWEVVEEGGYQRIRRKWRTRNFLAGVKLLERVAEVAEAEGHHPDLHLEGWNHARIDIYTHAIGGLHENDFVLAAKINGLHIEDLLRKPKTKITG
ncbi:hypothetical protein CLOM_g9873 [Closterium sp. NIES-68]|nr:hypothetical protein CLOM_g9873 [Closterium sp. NIES-68]